MVNIVEQPEALGLVKVASLVVLDNGHDVDEHFVWRHTEHGVFYTRLFGSCDCDENAYEVESLESIERLNIDALAKAVDPRVIGVEEFFKTVCGALRDSVA